MDGAWFENRSEYGETYRRSVLEWRSEFRKTILRIGRVVLVSQLVHALFAASILIFAIFHLKLLCSADSSPLVVHLAFDYL